MTMPAHFFLQQLAKRRPQSLLEYTERAKEECVAYSVGHRRSATWNTRSGWVKLSENQCHNRITKLPENHGHNTFTMILHGFHVGSAKLP
jgi:hypothetical protein